MFFVNLFVYITMVNKYSQKLLKEVRERFQNLIKEEKKKKGKKAWKGYKNLSEQEKENKRQYHHEVIRIFLIRKIWVYEKLSSGT